MAPLEQNSTYLPGIDWLRAFASLAVVAMHYDAFAPIKGYVLCLAVPLFMLISTVLFVRKPRSRGDLVHRTSTFLLWALVWPVLFYLANGGLPELIKVLGQAARGILNQPATAVHWLVSDLETNYFFFLSLAVVLALTFSLRAQKTGVLVGLLGLFLALVAALPFLLSGVTAVFNNPVNFLPFAPASILFVRWLNRPGTQKWLLGLGLVGLGIGAAFVEQSLQPFTTVVMGEQYSRISLFFLSIGILVLSLSIRRSNPVVDFLSRHSLPLYLVHCCLFPLVWTVVTSGYQGLLHGPAVWTHEVAWAVALVFSYLISVFVLPRFLAARLYRG